MHPENQHYVVIDRRTNRPADTLFFLLMPEHDVHAVEALRAYVRSLARHGQQMNAKRMNAMLRAFKAELSDDELLQAQFPIIGSA